MIISTLKIIFLLGFLIFIHEGGHFFTAKLCNVKVNQFSIGFGPKIWKYQGKETKYVLRLIPLGGFVSMEGEEKASSDERAFNNISILKRMIIVSAGALTNIIFGLIVYIVLALVVYKNMTDALFAIKEFVLSLVESIKMIFTGHIGMKDLTGPVGISGIISKTETIIQYLHLMSIISISLGITNLLPIPALDGGKNVILILEAIRKKPLKENTEITIQLIGFFIIIVLSVFVTYNDIQKIFY